MSGGFYIGAGVDAMSAKTMKEIGLTCARLGERRKSRIEKSGP